MLICFHELRDSAGVVGEGGDNFLAIDTQVEFLLGDVDAQVRGSDINRSHGNPFLQMRACFEQRLIRLFGLRDTRPA